MKNNKTKIEILATIILVIVIVYIVLRILSSTNTYVQTGDDQTSFQVIATSIIENIKARKFLEIDNYINDLSEIGVSKNIEDNIYYITVDNESDEVRIFGTIIPKEYVVEITIDSNSFKFNLSRNLTIHIMNRLALNDYSISTIIEHEKIDECNEPIISNSYFDECKVDLDENIVIPIVEINGIIKESSTEKREWYNYFAKNWAKVIVIPNEKKKNYLDENDKLKENLSINDVKDNIYVWIPNFTIKDGVTYFRYLSSKYQIKLSFIYEEQTYLYLNVIGDEIPNISDDVSFDGVNGVWRKLNDFEDQYYHYFNQTKYAPQNINL